MDTRSTHARAVRVTAPAAVVGALAAVLTAAPAEAAEPRRTDPMPARVQPQLAPTRTATVHHATARSTSYVVRPGDTVSGIAIRHGLRPADVLSWNGLGWRSVIYPGQTLRLTATAKPAAQPTAKPAATPSAAAKTHTVVRGDTVYAIARAYGTTVAKMIAANGLGRTALIHPGQKLRIGASAQASKPASGGSSAPAPAAATAKPTSHRVVAGDTLFAIAKKYGTTVAALLDANGLGNGSIIYPGQSLRLAPAGPAQRSANLDATQRAHAVHIIRVGRELGVPDRGIAIALATAMVESSMRNLDHGDRDSLGLFQQRPSQGWGTAKQILNADRSIRVFYGGPKDPNGGSSRGLLDIPGWQSRPFTDAAQAVQISAFPNRYGQWEQQANRWLATLR
ncbi:LysM peptidoglycan-binding domain-containing protein [Microbacterium sp. NPDC058342]|uniref:muramidase family protein n=1 Tax=Microbacterium sp. NPDC058342 TaxID=3346454 RepID=UPI003667DB0E